MILDQLLMNFKINKIQFGARLITASLLFVSCHILLVKGNHDNALQQMFAERTKEDWQAAWHVEKHRRCYQELVSHMELVCRHDIYNLMMHKRSKIPTSNVEQLSQSLDAEEHMDYQQSATDDLRNPSNNFQLEVPNDKFFLTLEEASSLWRHRTRSSDGRRIKRGGIMDECCSDAGCSWEEYAEYCPTNRRMRNRS